jgi:hypothetical protein
METYLADLAIVQLSQVEKHSYKAFHNAAASYTRMVSAMIFMIFQNRKLVDTPRFSWGQKKP